MVLRPATALIAKYTQAATQSVNTHEYLMKLELDLDKGRVAEWKEIEAQWTRKIIHMKNHKDMDNPYEPQKDVGEWQCIRLVDKLTKVCSIISQRCYGAVGRSGRGGRQRFRRDGGNNQGGSGVGRDEARSWKSSFE